MELRQLDYFVAVAHEKSFTLAAKRLHVVQSAVSAAIAALERDLKVTLFERNAQRVVLTEAGTALLPEALAVLDAVQGARDVVDELSGGLRGTVRVGVLGGLPLVDIPAIAGEFRRRYPGIELQLRVEANGSAGNERALLNGDIDVGFLAFAGKAPPELTSWELVRLPQVLAVPVGHRLARRRVVDLADLADESFVDFPIGFTNRTVHDQVFEQAGIRRRIAVEASGLTDAAEFVRHEVGVAILPPFAIDHEGLRRVTIRDHTFEWSLHMATLRKRKPTAAIRALLSLIPTHVQTP
ncbi:LysR family transcriptional regulator [Kribbella sp. NBC_01245]|uniref:LysR family transcriptional regulator n=1 Tax=Kribbella sp. NBC_01245 TaxID=2903578 RepID=UPI002E28ED7A|nr:LysR family transcriptional regulator [Kribbella sp. NBC_01245]